MHVIFKAFDDRGELVLKLERQFGRGTPWADLRQMYTHMYNIPDVVRITADIAI